jgi:hypothetical protein
MADQFTGRVEVQAEADGVATIVLGGNTGAVFAGAAGHAGAVAIKDSTGIERITIKPEAITIFDDAGQIVLQLNARGDVELTLGGPGKSGSVHVRDDQGEETAKLTGQGANLYLGGGSTDGDIWLFPEDGDQADTDTATIHLGGSSGDIVLQNADVAEDFDVHDPAGLEPGTVVVIGEDARLRASTRSYDRRVAGVVAGNEGSPRPGIILGRSPSGHARLPVALAGRVACRVDATASPITAGDLLTTSATPGHAMKAEDPARGYGAIIGKALRSQPGGTGVIPILVALQ